MPVKYDNSGGGAGGSVLDGVGVAGRIPYFTDPDTLSSDANLLWDSTNKRLTVAGSSTLTISEAFTLTDLSASNAWFGRSSIMSVNPSVDSPSDVVIAQNFTSSLVGTHSLGTSTVSRFTLQKTGSGALSVGNVAEFNATISGAGAVSLLKNLNVQSSFNAGSVTEGRGIDLSATGAATCSLYKHLNLGTPGAGITSSLGIHSEDQGLTNYFLHSLGGKNLLQGPIDLLSTLASSQLAFQTFSLTGLAQPFLNYDPTNYGSIEINGIHGGLSFIGLTDNGSTPISYTAIVGSTTVTSPAIFHLVAKANGAGGLQSLSASEICYEVNNGGASNIFDLYGNGAISINGATWTAQSRVNVKAPAYTAGTGTISNGGGATGGTITGTGTLFLTQLAVGDKIATSGSASTIGATVLTITDDTHCTVDYPQNWAGASFVIIKPEAIFYSSGNEANASIFPNGDFYGKSVHAYDAGSLIAISAAGFPKLGFGFLDPTLNHCFRTSGGSNTDLMLDVFGTTGGVAAHWFGVNGFFKTGFGASIGDTSFAVTAPVNGLYVNGQTAIGTSTPDASAKLDIVSTTQGFGLPVMTTAQKNAISSPRAGLVVFDTTLGTQSTYNGAIWI